MFATTFTAFLAASASLASAATIPVRRGGGTAGMTPHDAYGSSIGVLGCKVDTNRIAYWPTSVGCDDICVKVSLGERSLHLLKVDQSQGAHDISYDAWNYLVSGTGAAENPQKGGPVDMTWEPAPASECKDLLKDGKLPLSASNSINYLASCLAQPSSFVAQNHVLYNIVNSVCTWGVDEVCNLDLAVSNQPSCPGILGLTTPLAGHPVKNIVYATGEIADGV